MSKDSSARTRTPCVGICSTTYGDDVCRGCKRFIHEVINWNSFNPEEKEFPRVKYEELENYSDPLTSFIKVILYGGSSYTIDGRRIYKLVSNKSNYQKKILIKEYKNIWADHKRNDLEYLEVFFDKKDDVFPKKIKILFKGSVFSLIKT